jgi:hypothetical protein
MDRNTRPERPAPDWLERMLHEHEAAKEYQNLTPAELESLDQELSLVLEGIRAKLAEPFRRRFQHN